MFLKDSKHTMVSVHRSIVYCNSHCYKLCEKHRHQKGLKKRKSVLGKINIIHVASDLSSPKMSITLHTHPACPI